MIKVGLTGNICSGYEKVGLLFKSLGVPVFDADIALKFLINYREDIIRNIKIQFGEGIYEKGAIDPNKFNTTEKFDKLLSIAELELMRLYESWRFYNKDASYTIFKSSVLFERKLNDSMNYVISTFRPRDERASSLTRLGMKMIEAYDILDSEMDELLKNQRSEWIIHNYSDSLSLITQVKQIHEKIESKSIKSLLDRSDFSTVRNILS